MSTPRPADVEQLHQSPSTSMIPGVRITTKRGEVRNSSICDLCDRHLRELWRRKRSPRGAIIDPWVPCIRLALRDRLEGSWQIRISLVKRSKQCLWAKRRGWERQELAMLIRTVNIGFSFLWLHSSYLICPLCSSKILKCSSAAHSSNSVPQQYTPACRQS